MKAVADTLAVARSNLVEAALCQGHPAPGCQTILGLVSAWIEDYNTSRPHSGLRMLSLREFRARCA